MSKLTRLILVPGSECVCAAAHAALQRVLGSIILEDPSQFGLEEKEAHYGSCCSCMLLGLEVAVMDSLCCDSDDSEMLVRMGYNELSLVHVFTNNSVGPCALV